MHTHTHTLLMKVGWIFFFQGVNDIKTLTSEQVVNAVANLAVYLDFITLETTSPQWSNILTQFDMFFRRLPGLLPNPCDMGPILKIMTAVLKIPGLTSVKVRILKEDQFSNSVVSAFQDIENVALLYVTGGLKAWVVLKLHLWNTAFKRSYTHGGLKVKCC